MSMRLFIWVVIKKKKKKISCSLSLDALLLLNEWTVVTNQQFQEIQIIVNSHFIFITLIVREIKRIYFPLWLI